MNTYIDISDQALTTTSVLVTTSSARLKLATESVTAVVAVPVAVEAAIISSTAIRAYEACNRVDTEADSDCIARAGSSLLKDVSMVPSSVFATAELFNSISIALVMK